MCSLNRKNERGCVVEDLSQCDTNTYFFHLLNKLGFDLIREIDIDRNNTKINFLFFQTKRFPTFGEQFSEDCQTVDYTGVHFKKHTIEVSKTVKDKVLTNRSSFFSSKDY